MGDAEVKQIAKGFKITGVDDVSVAEVRQLLRAKLNLNPAQFILDLDNNEVALIGIVKDAMDKGIITSTTEGTSKVWILDGSQILVTKQGADELSSVVSEIESDLEKYFPLIEKGITSDEKSKKLAKPENAKFFDKFKSKASHTGDEILSADERKALQEDRLKEEKLKQVRGWYGVDVTDPNLHSATKIAGLIPEDQAEPIVALEEVTT